MSGPFNRYGDVRHGQIPYIRPETASQASIQLAIDRAHANWLATSQQNEVYVGNGNYQLVNLAHKSGVRLIFGDRARITKPGGTATVGSHHIRMHGSAGTGSALTADVAQRADTIPVANGALFAAGDVVLIREQTFVFSTIGQTQEVARVAAVSGNNVTLDARVSDAYTVSAAAELVKLNAVESAVLEGGEFINTVGTNTGGCINQRFSIDCIIKGVTGRNHNDEPVLQAEMACARGRWEDVKAIDGQNLLAGGYAYSFSIVGSSHDYEVIRATQRNCREATVGERASRTTWTKFDSAKSQYVIGPHGAGCRDNTFRQIVSVQDEAGLFLGGNAQADHRTAFYDVEIYNPGGAAISLASSDPAKRHQGVTLRRFKVVGPRQSTVVCIAANADNVWVSDGDIDVQGFGASAGVQLSSVSVGGVSDVTVRNIPAGYGMTLSGTDDCLVRTCEVYGAGSTDYRGMTGSTSQRNFFEQCHSTKAAGSAMTMQTGHTARNNTWQ